MARVYTCAVTDRLAGTCPTCHAILMPPAHLYGDAGLKRLEVHCALCCPVHGQELNAEADAVLARLQGRFQKEGLW